MSEETSAEDPVESPQGAAADQVQIKPFEIPQEAIDRWASLPYEGNLLVPLSRRDLDHLFYGLRNSVISQLHLGQAVGALTKGNQGDADAHFQQHTAICQNAYSLFNTFIANVMTTAFPESNDG